MADTTAETKNEQDVLKRDVLGRVKTPTIAGKFDFSTQVSDSSSPVQSVTRTLSITVASIPIALGNTNDGTLTDPMGTSWINAGRFHAAADLTATTMFAKVVGVNGRYKCAIYGESNGQPSRLLSATAEISNPSTGWHSFPLTSSVMLTNGQYYWLAIWSDDPNSRAYHSGNAGTLRWGWYDYGDWPDPLVAPSSASINYCIYATGPANPPESLANLSESLVLHSLRLPGTKGTSLNPARLSIATTNDVVAITWGAVPGLRYVLEYSDDLQNTNWVALPAVLATNWAVTVTDPAANVPRRFYRAYQAK